jgi:hypothetical protein
MRRTPGLVSSPLIMLLAGGPGTGKVKTHSKREEKMQNYTRNEWRRCKITLETSGEYRVPLVNFSPSSLDLRPSQLATFSELKSSHSPLLVKITLETSGKDVKLHSKRVEKM